MNSWKRFSEILLSAKKKFYSYLTVETIADTATNRGKRVWEDFWIKKLGDTYGLYVQSNTLLLLDVSESFCNMCSRYTNLI